MIKFMVLSIAILSAGVALNHGDWIWLLLVFTWAAITGMLLWPRKSSMYVVSLGAVIILAHFNGYKIFGNPSNIDNLNQFGDTFDLDYIELPNVFIATDGSRHVIDGIQFNQEIAESAPQLLRRVYSTPNEPFRFLHSTATPSRYEGIYRVFRCGNTYVTDMILLSPRDLYRKGDLAYMLEFCTESDK